MYNQGKIMRRLLGRPTAEPLSNENNLSSINSPVPLSYRPTQSQDATHLTSAPVSCLDRSTDGQFAVVGGAHVLKILQIEGKTVKEGLDIRALITSQSTSKNSAFPSSSEQLSIRDVRWAAAQNGDPTIFTACANGRIFNYNISRLGTGMTAGAGLEVVQMREDSRQINKLDINPHRSTWLLSGSTDGTVRCFDTKAPVTNRNGHAIFRSFQVFKGIESIHDVKWSPKDGMVFACATENGSVLKWDIRKASAPLLKLNAHDTLRGASSISWHPDGYHLLSAGRDSKCHVWDMSASADKKQKPKWSISTPAPVSAVAWRPALWSATARGRRAAQVAVAYDDGGSSRGNGISAVHIWDFGRPTMPFKEIDRFDFPPKGLLWHDQDILWTAGAANTDGGKGLFAQCDVAFASRVIDRQSLSSLDFSPRGDVLMFLEERAHPPRPRPASATHDAAPISSYSSSPSGQVLSISRSDSEEDVVGSFLGPRRRGSRRRGGSNNRSGTALSSTPPSAPGAEDPPIPLDQSISLTGAFRPQQVMAIGSVPAASKAGIYQYLSAHYLETLKKELPFVVGGKSLKERVSSIMEHYACAAENVSQFRLAQTWRVLAYAFDLLLARRSQYHLELRTTLRRSGKSPSLKGRLASQTNLTSLASAPKALGDVRETPRISSSVDTVDSHQTLGRSLVPEDVDSESNAATPLARPVREDVSDKHKYMSGKILTPVQELDSFKLPPAFQTAAEYAGPRKRLDSVPLSVVSQDSQISSTEGYDFYDLDAVTDLPNAIDVPRKKDPLHLNSVEPLTPNSRKRMVMRHDSDESFVQMFSVSEGKTATTSSLGSSVRYIANDADPLSASTQSPRGEYPSHIRGEKIPDSLESDRNGISKFLERADSGSLREIFMISQTTDDSGGSELARTATFGSSQQSVEHSQMQLKVNPPQSPRKTSNERLALERPEEKTSGTITETDFMPWPDDPPYPHPLSAEGDGKLPTSPLKPYDLLSRALAFEAKHSALNAAAMILLLKPLVPDGLIDSHQASAILRQYHNRLMGQKLFIEAALLRNLCVGDWPEGVAAWGDNYPAVFLPAQERVKVGFACSQCHKPREVHPSDVGGMGIWKCERCRAVMAPCAVCGHRDATQASLPLQPITDGLTSPGQSQSDSILAMWWYCPGCGHGGHATCLQGWHAPVSPSRLSSGTSTPAFAIDDGLFPETFSDGCCPLDGCGHACLPGKWRNESSAARTEELGRAVREHTRSDARSSVNAGSAPAVVGGVRSDALEVSQSRAVEGVREALANAGLGAAPSGVYPAEDGSRLSRAAGGILSVLSSSPGRSSTFGMMGDGSTRDKDRERRKSVKFAGPPEERQR
ncbi:hypothetical protein BX600DRAFT_447767 [Xylariales sp. PMI_506]|nr:hypothetical protein BX600DRAFT_447767 [Xylariales sp. PMI_506]